MSKESTGVGWQSRREDARLSGGRKRLNEMIPASGGRLDGGQGAVLEHRVSELSEEWEEQTEPREQQERPSWTQGRYGLQSPPPVHVTG